MEISETNPDQSIDFTVSIQPVCSSCGFPLNSKKGSIENSTLKLEITQCRVCSDSLKDQIMYYVGEVRHYISDTVSEADNVLNSLMDEFERSVQSHFVVR